MPWKLLTLIALIIRGHVWARECFDDGNEFCIDRDDILSVDLLPGSFLFKEPGKNLSLPGTEGDENFGSMGKALDEMDFHR